MTVYTGTSPHGQGLETAFAQIVADRLGHRRRDMVEVIHGDTGTGPFGLGTYGSRSLAVGGEAIARATAKVVDKAQADRRPPARGRARGHRARRRQVLRQGLARQGHDARPRSPARAYIPENLPEGMEPGLEETRSTTRRTSCSRSARTRASSTWTPETGKVDVVRYVAVDDCGPAINPMLIDGQVHGGIAHAIGQALFERIHYDEDGQLVTGTFVDYALPSAADVPSFETDRTETPSPVNSLGVKGVGEAGTIARHRPRSSTRSSTRCARSASTYINMPLERWRDQRPGRGTGSSGMGEHGGAPAPDRPPGGGA